MAYRLLKRTRGKSDITSMNLKQTEAIKVQSNTHSFVSGMMEPFRMKHLFKCQGGYREWVTRPWTKYPLKIEM